MAIENNGQIINEICTKSGLTGAELTALRERLSKLNRAELEAELVSSLVGNSDKGKDHWIIEHSDSIVDLSNYAKTETVDKQGNRVTEYRDGEYLAEKIIEGKKADGTTFKTTITYRNNKPFHKYEEENGKTTVTEYTYNEITEDNFFPLVSVKKTLPDGTVIKDTVFFTNKEGNYNQSGVLTRTTSTTSGEIIRVFPIGEGKLAEIRTNTQGETVRTIYSATSIAEYNNETKPKRLYQDVITSKGASALKYDGNGNTITTTNAGDGWERLARRFHTTELRLKELNPKIKSLRAGEDIVVPGEFNVYSKEIAKVEHPQVAKAKAHNAEIDRKIKEEVLKDVKESYAKELVSCGFRGTVENYGFYQRFKSYEDRDQYQIVQAIKYYAKSEKIANLDEIKEKLLSNLGYNLFDSGKTVSMSLTPAEQMTMGGGWSKKGNVISVETFITKVLKLNITTGTGLALYERLASMPQERLSGIQSNRYGDMTGVTLQEIFRALGVQTQNEIQQEKAMQLRREEIAGDGPIRRKQTVDFAYQQVKKAREALEARLAELKDSPIRNIAEIMVEDYRFWGAEHTPIVSQTATAMSALARKLGFRRGTLEAFTKSIRTKIDELRDKELELFKLQGANLSSDKFLTEYRRILHTDYKPEAIETLRELIANKPQGVDDGFLRRLADNVVTTVFTPEKSDSRMTYAKQVELAVRDVIGESFADEASAYLGTSSFAGTAIETAAFCYFTAGMGTLVEGAGTGARILNEAARLGTYTVIRTGINFVDDIDNVIRGEKTIGGVLIGEENAQKVRDGASVIKDWALGKISREEVDKRLKKIGGLTFDDFVTSNGGQLVVNTAASAIFGAAAGAAQPLIVKAGEFGTKVGQKLGISAPDITKVTEKLLLKNPQMSGAEFMAKTYAAMHGTNAVGKALQFAVTTAVFYSTNLPLSLIQEKLSESNGELEKAYKEGRLGEYLLARLGQEAVNLLQLESIGYIVAMITGNGAAAQVQKNFEKYETLQNTTIRYEDVTYRNQAGELVSGKAVTVEGPTGKLVLSGNNMKFYINGGQLVSQQNIGAEGDFLSLDAGTQAICLLGKFMQMESYVKANPNLFKTPAESADAAEIRPLGLENKPAEQQASQSQEQVQGKVQGKIQGETTVVPAMPKAGQQTVTVPEVAGVQQPVTAPIPQIRINMPSSQAEQQVQSVQNEDRTKKPYVAPAIKEIKLALETEVLSSEIEEFDNPNSRDLWESCKLKARVILGSITEKTVTLPTSVKAQLSELVKDIKVLSTSTKSKVRDKFSKISEKIDKLISGDSTPQTQEIKSSTELKPAKDGNTTQVASQSIVTPRVITSSLADKRLIDEYKDKCYPYYDADNARFSPEANARTLEKVTPASNEAIIEVSNFDKIDGQYPGTIAGTTTLDKTLYTDRIAQCAVMVVVDRKHNTQSLIHCYPGNPASTSELVIKHIIESSNPKDLEISIIPGYDYVGTEKTIQFLLDEANKFAPDAKIELCNFLDYPELSIFERGIMVKDGKIVSCDSRDIKSKKVTNPENVITYCKFIKAEKTATSHPETNEKEDSKPETIQNTPTQSIPVEFPLSELSPAQRVQTLDKLFAESSTPIHDGEASCRILPNGNFILKTEGHYVIEVPADNVHGISNRVAFDKDGLICGYESYTENPDGTITHIARNYEHGVSAEEQTSIEKNSLSLTERRTDKNGTYNEQTAEYDQNGYKTVLYLESNNKYFLRKYEGSTTYKRTTVYDNDTYYDKEEWFYPDGRVATQIFDGKNWAKISIDPEGNVSGDVDKFDANFDELYEKAKARSVDPATINAEVPDGCIRDKKTGEIIKVDPEKVHVEKRGDNQSGIIEIKDERGNLLGNVHYSKKYNYSTGEETLYFDSFGSKVNGAGIGSKIIQELVKLSEETGLPLTAHADACPLGFRTPNKKPTNLKFYYKMGFVAEDEGTDKLVRECIENGTDIPVSLNRQVPIRYVGKSKSASVEKSSSAEVKPDTKVVNNPKTVDMPESADSPENIEEETVAPFARRLLNSPTVEDLTFVDRSKVRLENGEFDENGNFVSDGTYTITENNPFGKSKTYAYPDKKISYQESAQRLGAIFEIDSVDEMQDLWHDYPILLNENFVRFLELYTKEFNTGVKTHFTSDIFLMRIAESGYAIKDPELVMSKIKYLHEKFGFDFHSNSGLRNKELFESDISLDDFKANFEFLWNRRSIKDFRTYKDIYMSAANAAEHEVFMHNFNEFNAHNYGNSISNLILMLGNQKATVDGLMREVTTKYPQLKLNTENLSSSEIYSLVVLKAYQAEFDKALSEGKLDGTNFDVESLAHLISSAAHDEIKNNQRLYDFLFDYAKQNPNGVDICSVWGRFYSHDIYAWGSRLNFEEFTDEELQIIKENKLLHDEGTEKFTTLNMKKHCVFMSIVTDTGRENYQYQFNKAMENPELYVNGTYATKEEAQAQVKGFFENWYSAELQVLSTVFDKETMNHLLRMRLSDVQDYIKLTYKFDISDWKMIESLSNSCNVDGKPFMPQQKVEFIDLLYAYKENNLSTETITAMLENGKVDLGKLKMDLLKAVMKNSGLTEEEIAQIPPERLMSWDTRYVHLLAKDMTSEISDKDDIKALKDVVRAANLTDLETYIHDESNIYGQTNARTREIFAKSGVDYDRWLHPSKDNEVRFTRQDKNTELLQQTATQLCEDMNTLLKGPAKKFIQNQFPKFVKQVGEDLVFELPEEYSTNASKLEELINIISDESQQGQLYQVWSRARANAASSDENKRAKASGTIAILDHLAERKSTLSQIEQSGSEKPVDITIKMWDRVPQKDLFQGNYSTCCIAMGGGNDGAMPHFIMDTAYNMIELVDNNTGKVIGNALCYMITTSDGKPAFVVDNVEIAGSARLSDAAGYDLRQAITEYADNVSREITGRDDIPIYISSNYNDIPYEDLPASDREISFMGDIDCDEIYMDLYHDGSANWVDKEDLTGTYHLLQLKGSEPIEHKFGGTVAEKSGSLADGRVRVNAPEATNASEKTSEETEVQPHPGIKNSDPPSRGGYNSLSDTQPLTTSTATDGRVRVNAPKETAAPEKTSEETGEQPHPGIENSDPPSRGGYNSLSDSQPLTTSTATDDRVRVNAPAETVAPESISASETAETSQKPAEPHEIPVGKIVENVEYSEFETQNALIGLQFTLDEINSIDLSNPEFRKYICAFSNMFNLISFTEKLKWLKEPNERMKLLEHCKELAGLKSSNPNEEEYIQQMRAALNRANSANLQYFNQVKDSGNLEELSKLLVHPNFPKIMEKLPFIHEIFGKVNVLDVMKIAEQPELMEYFTTENLQMLSNINQGIIEDFKFGLSDIINILNTPNFDELVNKYSQAAKILSDKLGDRIIFNLDKSDISKTTEDMISVANMLENSDYDLSFDHDEFIDFDTLLQISKRPDSVKLLSITKLLDSRVKSIYLNNAKDGDISADFPEATAAIYNYRSQDSYSYVAKSQYQTELGLWNEGKINSELMEIGKKINSKIKKDSSWDYKFNFSNMTSLEKLKNSMPITDEQIDAYAEQINICLDNLKDKSASFSIFNRDDLFEDGLTGATEKIARLNKLFEKGFELPKSELGTISVKLTKVIKLAENNNPDELVQFLNTLSGKNINFGTEIVSESAIPATKESAEFLTKAIEIWNDENNHYYLIKALKQVVPKSDGTFDYEGFIELLRILKADENISNYDTVGYLKIKNGEYSTAVKFVELLNSLKTSVEWVAEFYNTILNKSLEENVDTESALKALDYLANEADMDDWNGGLSRYDIVNIFGSKQPYEMLERCLFIKDNFEDENDMVRLMRRYEDSMRNYEGENYEQISTEDFKAKFEFIKEAEGDVLSRHPDPALHVCQLALTDIPFEEYKTIYTEIKAKYPRRYHNILTGITKANKDNVLELLSTMSDNHLYSLQLRDTANNMTDNNRNLILELNKADDISYGSIAEIAFYTKEKYADIAMELYKNENIDNQDIGCILSQINDNNRELALTMLRDPEVPKQNFVSFLRIAQEDKIISMVKDIYENKTIPMDVLFEILPKLHRDAVDDVVELINSGQYASHPYLKDYDTRYWRAILEKGLNPETIPEKFREFMPQYAKANDPDIAQNHQLLYEAAYKNRDILKSGQDDLTDEDLDDAFLDKNVVATLDFVGLGNLEAAFPLQIDSFEDLCEDIAQINLSADNRRLLSAKLTPTHCEEYRQMETELKNLKIQLNKALGKENIQKIKEIQAQKTQTDEQVKELNTRLGMLDANSEEALELKKQIKELTKQSKALNGQAQSVYFTSENSAQIKELMKEINTKNKAMKTFVQEHSGLEPQDVVLKLRVLAALDFGNLVTEEKMKEFIELIKPKTPENEAIWNRKVNEKIFEKLNVEYDETLSDKLNLLDCKYLSQMLVSSEDFFSNMKILVEQIKSHPDMTIEEAFNELPQNKITKGLYEKLGVNYDKWVQVDKNSYVAIEVELDADEAKQAAIQNLEADFNDAEFKKLPAEIQDGILESLKKIGVTLEQSYEDVWVGDGEAAGTREYYRLYKDGNPVKFEDLDKIISTIKQEINSKQFWSTRNSNSEIEGARDHVYTHFKLRRDDVKKAQDIKNGEVVKIEVRKTDMNDVKKSIGLGNDGQCCTGLGKQFNEWSAPTYVMNKCIGAIEVVDGDIFCGNSMIYLAYVDGEPALVLDNIELKTKYQYNDKIRDAILEYAKKLCVEIGQPDLPIFAGPNRHKLTMSVYPKATHTMQVIGNTGDDQIYLDYDIGHHKIDGTETATIEMYRMR